jgi:hypothetical protein
MTQIDDAATFLAELAGELRGGDDRELWELVVRRVVDDFAKLDALEPAPRRLLVAFARVPGTKGALHPDEHASMHLAWEKDRGADWRFAGPNPHWKRRRGAYAATVCVPQGTTRLAWIDVVVLWRPRPPWAGPEQTEMGRQSYRFHRDVDARWRFGGAREE